MSETEKRDADARGDAMSRPSIDHTILSPSGRVSKRARAAALAREAARLFPPGTWNAATPQPNPALVKRRYAAELRALAARGMSTRAFTRQAEKLEREAEELEAAEPNAVPRARTSAGTS